MLTVKRVKVMSGVHLTYVYTQKFKTGCLSVNFLTQLDTSTASKNALLPNVLLCGTSEYKDINALERQLASLYGARIEPYVRKKGEIQSIGFYCEFVDDDYLPSGSDNLEKTAQLLGEIITSPNTRGGLLLPAYVEVERKKLVDRIQAVKNDKQAYSMQRLCEEMCSGEAFGVPVLGYAESASQITHISLTKQYRSVISSSEIEVFYCGGASLDRVSDALSDAFSSLYRSDSQQPCFTDVRLSPSHEEPVIMRETMDVTQAKLSMGFRIGSAMAAPNFPALTVFNSVFGGSLTSKLFTNVRERLSLAYYASSVIDKHKGIMQVVSGIDDAKFDLVFTEIMRQLEAVRSGNVTEDEMKGAVLSTASSLRRTGDSQIMLENFCFDMALLGLEFSPEDMAALSSTVTKDEVTKIAEGVALDTVFLLTGGGDANG